ncbi:MULTISPECIES: RHS repeat-associated core domain-containing protein [Pseudomonas]|uniref:RHS repeat-associated core domain-containing protein n=1 Tax=Pseudomonas peradeniyensis TaxID=2745488 RepID=A0ABT2V994_9PSED|nr:MULTISPECIES: RHS repeat-associated core domain-containing protein [Pseudomonas]MCU7237972.1 RHS repeat-associated core domain-containing protein [Pseudomonas peradeniyensis]MCU7282368.1 RHS repeat-associated core domain-containing protein [Pseudomonas peradeniyensis]
MSERINDLKVPACALLQCDLAGSVLSAHGTAQRMLSYTAYGYLADPVRKGAVGFNGQLLEGDVHGYLLGNGHRLYYLPFMRFSSPDALSPFGEGGLNAYAYCEGEPVNNFDPDGKFSIKKLFFGKTDLTKKMKYAGISSDLKPYLKARLNLGETVEFYHAGKDRKGGVDFRMIGGKAITRLRPKEVSGSEEFYRKGDLFIINPTDQTYGLMRGLGFKPAPEGPIPEVTGTASKQDFVYSRDLTYVQDKMGANRNNSK